MAYNMANTISAGYLPIISKTGKIQEAFPF